MTKYDNEEEQQYYDSIKRHFNPFHTLIHGKRESLFDLVKKEQRGLPRSTLWFRSKIRELAGTQVDTHKLYENERPSHVSRPKLGRMYMMYYWPKTRDTLPYYDRFPLIIPFEMYRDSTLSIQLHYLRPITRIMLMDKLIDLASNQMMDAKTKLRVSYQILSNVSRYPEVAPTIKKHLFSHVKSRYILIEPDEWTIAMLLPTEQFKKATKQQVWSESAQMIRKKRMRR